MLEETVGTTLPDPVFYAIPLFGVLILAELFWMKRRGGIAYEGRDAAASLAMGFGSLVPGLLKGVVLYAAFEWVHGFALFDIGFQWWAFVAVFFAEDFCYYWFHRLSHEHRIWWAAHVNHHSSQHYNLSTALRQTWTGQVALTWSCWLPLSLLGFPTELIFFQLGVSLVYQFWIHTEAVRRLPAWFEAVFNTPSHHRVHHATNARYLDANYGGILIVWDRLFGTFVAETAGEPCRYGIVKNLGSFNPLVIASHEWVALFRDLARARTWRGRLKTIFGPPGWREDGQGSTSADIRRQWQAKQGQPAE